LSQVAIVVCVNDLFSSHLSQGYHDLRISVDRKFKISKGVEVSCLWNLIFGSSEKIFGGSGPQKF
jgi:hypothetical protein